MSHYDILGAPANAEYAEIRSKYRGAILALHPDKLPGSCGQPSQDLNSTSNEDNITLPNKPSSTIKDLDVDDPQFDWATISGAGELCIGEGDVLLSRFLRVQEAWEVLRDPRSRAKYDAFLRAERLAHEMQSTRIIGDEIHLREMEYGSVNLDHGKYVEYTYPCRCGDLIVVSQEELQMAGVEFDAETSQDAGSGTRGKIYAAYTEGCCTGHEIYDDGWGRELQDDIQDFPHPAKHSHWSHLSAGCVLIAYSRNDYPKSLYTRRKS